MLGLLAATVLAVDAGADSPARFENQYLVILTQGGSVEVPLTVKYELPADADFAQLASSDFSNLKPCLTISVARGFAEKADAVKYVAALKKKSLQSYVKKAGHYSPNDPLRAKVCAMRAAKRLAAASPRFVIDVVGQSYVQLGGEVDVAVERVAGTTDVAMAPLAADPKGEIKRGAKFDVITADGFPLKCTVTGFAAINRASADGLPDDEETRPRLFKPSCGVVAPYAKLKCDYPVKEPAIALPPGQNAVWFATASGDAREQLARSFFEKSPELKSALTEGKKAARPDAPFSQEVRVTVFVDAKTDTAVVVAQADVKTGDGFNLCGQDVFHKQPMLVLRYPRADAAPEVVYRAENDERDVRSVFDLAGDGVPSLLFQAGSDVSLNTASESPVHESIYFCGCGC
ncbi:MAG: hypothetical protein JNM17_27485 [Archangium sp.]|nr:hypothetical protein [Archangium sp.]